MGKGTRRSDLRVREILDLSSEVEVERPSGITLGVLEEVKVVKGGVITGYWSGLRGNEGSSFAWKGSVTVPEEDVESGETDIKLLGTCRKEKRRNSTSK